MDDFTTVRMNKKMTERISVLEGVRRGDSVNSFLFNPLINELIKEFEDKRGSTQMFHIKTSIDEINYMIANINP